MVADITKTPPRPILEGPIFSLFYKNKLLACSGSQGVSEGVGQEEAFKPNTEEPKEGGLL